jgi:exonuclease SbcD
MKILHTGDWHIGHVLYGYDRACDHDAMLRSLCNVVADEQPDVMVVSGDIFHSGQPSAAAQHMLQHYLLAMHHNCPTMAIVATAGNHDSPSRHEAHEDLWRESNIVMVGQINCNSADQITDETLDSLIVPVADKGFVIAMPFVHVRNLPDNFYQLLLDRVAERNAAGLPVVLMAHLAVGSADFTGHEVRDERIVGSLDVVPLSSLGSGYDYLALGHIHHAQFVPDSNGTARYAGSPLAVNFDEAYAHTVSIVDIPVHGANPEVREAAIDGGRRLITLGGAKGMPWPEVQSNLPIMLADQDLPKGSLIRVNIHLANGEVLPGDAEAVVRKTVTEADQLFCRINVVRDSINRAISDRDLNADELRKIPPITLAKRYAADIDVPFTAEMEAMFNEIVNLVKSQQDEN